LFREGISFTIFPYRVYYIFHEDEACFLQSGFGVSARNFKKAVDRNRVKRLSKEAYRLQKEIITTALKNKQCCLALFFVYNGKELPTQPEAFKKIGLILQRLITLINEKSSLPA
jgi:ribonuclease P protein component